MTSGFPVILFLRYIDHVDPVKYLKLKKNWKQGILIGIVFSIINFVGGLIRFGTPQPNIQSLTWNSILSTSFLIGFFEEIPYRGFILQKLKERYSFWIANLLSSLLFLSIHLPGWISLHIFTIEKVILVFIFGFGMAIIFKFSKSLWGPIITHSLNDFISVIIFHR